LLQVLVCRALAIFFLGRITRLADEKNMRSVPFWKYFVIYFAKQRILLAENPYICTPNYESNKEATHE